MADLARAMRNIVRDVPAAALAADAQLSELLRRGYDQLIDQLNELADKTLGDILSAAIAGTNQAYAEDNRPTADIVVDDLDEHAMGQLLQMMMLATVAEGRLIGINPYGQPGVEAYKKNMNAILRA